MTEREDIEYFSEILGYCNRNDSLFFPEAEPCEISVPGEREYAKEK